MKKHSKFFHSVVKVKTAKNHISSLISDTGTHISNLPTLREMAAEFYKNLFNHAGYWNVFPKLVAKKRLTPDVAAWLDRYVSAKEIHQAVSDMHPDKAPGPDGYNALFSQKKLESDWD